MQLLRRFWAELGMTTKDTKTKILMTELIIMADSELEDKQKLDGGYTVEAINNVSAIVEH